MIMIKGESETQYKFANSAMEIVVIMMMTGSLGLV